MSPAVAMPAAATSAGDIGDITQMICGLGNRAAICWSSRGSCRPNQTCCRYYDYREHHMTKSVLRSLGCQGPPTEAAAFAVA